MSTELFVVFPYYFVQKWGVHSAIPRYIQGVDKLVFSMSLLRVLLEICSILLIFSKIKNLVLYCIDFSLLFSQTAFKIIFVISQ